MSQVNPFSRAFEELEEEPCLPGSPATENIGPIFNFGSFRLQADGALRRGAELVHLPPKELAALRLLLAHAGQIVTPAHIKLVLWGEVHVTADSVPRCMSSLRSRLEPEDCIQTIYKQGYRITAEVKMEKQPSTTGAQRLAILPLSVGPYAPEHLGAMVAEETIAEMVSIGQSRTTILARDSGFLLAGRGLSSVEIGKTLGADLVLTGSIISLVAHFRLRAEMIRVADGAQIWVEDLVAPESQPGLLALALVERLLFRLGAGKLRIAERDVRPTPSTLNQPEVQKTDPLTYYKWRALQQRQILEDLQQLDHVAELEPRLKQTISTN